MPTATLFRGGENMFQWLHFQKKMQKHGTLSAYRIARLEKKNIGWSGWKTIKEIVQLKQIFIDEGSCTDDNRGRGNKYY